MCHWKEERSSCHHLIEMDVASCLMRTCVLVWISQLPDALFERLPGFALLCAWGDLCGRWGERSGISSQRNHCSASSSKRRNEEFLQCFLMRDCKMTFNATLLTQLLQIRLGAANVRIQNSPRWVASVNAFLHVHSIRCWFWCCFTQD